MAAVGGRQVPGGEITVGDGVRPHVGLDHVVPHAHGQEDVGGHVLRVSGVGRQGPVRSGGSHRQRGVSGVVERMDRVVRGPGMVRVLPEQVQGDGARTHVGRHVAVALTQAQEGKRVERARLEVLGVVCSQLLHFPGVQRVQRLLLALASPQYARAKSGSVSWAFLNASAA